MKPLDVARSTNNPIPIVLIFVNFYLPGYRGGGPTRTIANLVASLGDEFDFRIVTMDRDLGDLCPYNSIQPDVWTQVGKAQVFYASPAAKSFRRIVLLLQETQFDVLYLNSFFHINFTLKPLVARKLMLIPKKPVILAPRGEFSTGALRIKRARKTLFLVFSRWMGLFNEVIWHSSTDYESLDIQRRIKFERSKILVACNIAAPPESPNAKKSIISEKITPASSGIAELRVCFLSRISPKKNLDYAINVLAQTKSSIVFNIFGPKESAVYWEECESLIRQLPPNVRVKYCGSVEYSLVASIIAQHDLFFVPTRGENFGHVFMEAFSAGVPILVSDQTPWRDLKSKNLGWDIPLDDINGFVQAVEDAAKLDSATRIAMRESCISFARDRQHDVVTVDQNRNLFLRAIELST